MAEPAQQPSQTLPAKESAELASYRAKDAREKRIAEIMAERSAICSGAIHEPMLRQIALAQVAHDEREARAAK